MRIEELWRKTVSGEKGLAYSFFRFFLSILTIPYLIGFFLFRKIQSHRAVKLPCPVIGIGNITLGGTGKTSLAILLGRKLEEMGLKIAILCTGYGGKRGGKVKGKTVEEVGDEAVLLSKCLRKGDVWAGRDRLKMAREALREGVEVIILDDSMQYFKIKKDLEIAMLNAFSPFGYGYLFPRGALREPISGLRRADIIILTNSDLVENKGKIVERIKEINPKALIVEANYKAKGLFDISGEEFREIEWLRGRRVRGIAGIGCPEGFRKSLEGLVGETVFRSLPDHYSYKCEDIKRLEEEAREKGLEAIVITEKDGVKIKELMEQGCTFKVPILILRAELTLSPEDVFWEKVQEAVRKVSIPYR
ncbi:MAG: tetraacyldisaccharide 4'-kinase [bacterium]